MTALQVVWDARCLSGEKDTQDPTDAECLRYLNLALARIEKLLFGLDPRFGGRVCLLNLADAGAAHFSSSASYNPTTYTVTQSGAFASVSATGLLMAYGTDGSFIHTGIAYAVSKTASTLVLDRDIMAGLGTPTTFYYIYIPAASTSELTLTIPTDVSEITMAEGSLSGMIHPKDIDGYLASQDNPNDDSLSVMYQQGSTLKVYSGTDLASGSGVVILWYRGRHKVVTTMSQTIDLPIKYHGILRDELAKTLLLRRGKVPPPELKDPLESLKAQAKALKA